MLFLINYFFLFSGAAALIYQVVWVRFLGLTFGVAHESVATVLAAFFLGLAVGSMVADWVVRKGLRGFGVYGTIELSIAFFGYLSVPILLGLPGWLAGADLGSDDVAARFGILMALLSMPTVLIGMTFPVLIAVIVRTADVRIDNVSGAYAYNTAGGVMGVLVGTFILIPWIGLDGAAYVAVGLNVLVGSIALCMVVLKKLFPKIIEASDQPPFADRQSAPAPDKKAQNVFVSAAVLFATGFVLLASEVAWSKYLGVFVGGTLYGFAIILSAVLFGIAYGSRVMEKAGRRWNFTQAEGSAIMVGLVLLSAVALVLSRLGLGALPDVQDYLFVKNWSVFAETVVRYGIVWGVIFLPAFFLGALFPVSLQAFAVGGKGGSIGGGYAVNTVAGIFGAIVAGFVAIPLIGTDGLLRYSAALIVLLSIGISFYILQGRLRQAAIGVGVVVLTWNAVAPPLDYENLIRTVHYDFNLEDYEDMKSQEFLYLKEGKNRVISLATLDGDFVRLQSNGLSETRIYRDNPKNQYHIEQFLGFIPSVLTTKTDKAFVIGYGGGTTARMLLNFPFQNVRVAELEPAVLEAAEYLGPYWADLLKDPRLNVQVDDGRNVLLQSNETFDVIVSQPSHPWLAGMSNLYSYEFWSLARARLADKGVFAQWVNLFNMKASTLKSIFKGFFQVFPYGFAVVDLESRDLILIGSPSDLLVDFYGVNAALTRPSLTGVFDPSYFAGPEDLFWYFGLSRREALRAAGAAEPATDANIVTETQLGFLKESGTGSEDPFAFLQRHGTMDILPYLAPAERLRRLGELATYFDAWDRPREAAHMRHLLEQLQVAPDS